MSEHRGTPPRDAWLQWKHSVYAVDDIGGGRYWRREWAQIDAEKMKAPPVHQTCKETNARKKMRVRGRRSEANMNPNQYVRTYWSLKLKSASRGSLQGGAPMRAQATQPSDRMRGGDMQNAHAVGSFVIEQFLRPQNGGGRGAGSGSSVSFKLKDTFLSKS
jgi:hypothetical protein